MSGTVREAAGARLRRRLSGLAVLAFSAVCVWLALRGLDWSQLGALAARAEPGWIAAGTAGLASALLLRTVRWLVVLRDGPRVPFLPAFWCIVAGYLGNVLLPARVGDVLRCMVLGQRQGISRAFVFGTVLLERVTDAAVLSIVVALGVSRLPGMPDWLSEGSRALAIAAIFLFATLLLAPGLAQRGLLQLSRPLGARMAGLVGGFLTQLVDGFAAVRRPGRMALFVLLTAAIWTLDSAALVALAHAFGLALGLAEAAFVVAALGLSMAAPSAPGYVGIYHLVAVTVMAPLGFAKAEALATVLAMQGAEYALLALLGPIGLWQLEGWRYLRLRRPDAAA